MFGSGAVVDDPNLAEVVHTDGYLIEVGIVGDSVAVEQIGMEIFRLGVGRNVTERLEPGQLLRSERGRGVVAVDIKISP